MGFTKVKSLARTGLSNNTYLPWKVNWKDDLGLEVPGYFAILHDLSALWPTSDNPADSGDLSIHFVKGLVRAPLCNHLYFDESDPNSECEFCKLPSYFPNQEFNQPLTVKPLLVVCLNLIDQKKDSKDGTKQYDCNPLKILELRYKKNFQAVEDAHQEGMLSIYDNPEAILTMHQTADAKGKASKLSEPRFCSSTDLKKVGRQFKYDLANADPKTTLGMIYQQFNPAGRSKSELEQLHAEIRGLIFEQYGNVRKNDKLFMEDIPGGVIWPKVEVLESSEASEDEYINVDK